MRILKRNNSVRSIGLIGILALFMLLGMATPSMADGACGDLETLKDGSCACPDPKLQDSITKAASGAKLARMEEVSMTYGKATDSTAGITNWGGSIYKTYCFEIIDSSFSSIQGLLMSWVAAAIDAIINAILNYVCSVVAEFISDILNAICLPMLPLLPSLRMPGTGRSSCDGYSLEDFIRIQYRPLLDLPRPPSDYILYPLSRMLESKE